MTAVIGTNGALARGHELQFMARMDAYHSTQKKIRLHPAETWN